MKTIGPDHPITVAPHAGRVRVTFRGRPVADSDDVLVLREAAYPPVFYFPRADVRMEALARTDHATYCPYKGHAAYYSLADGDTVSANAIWTYETPYEQMASITDRLAFYPDRVSFEVTPPSS